MHPLIKQVSSTLQALKKKERELYELLVSKSSGLTLQEISEKLKVSKRTAWNYVQKLLNLGLLEKEASDGSRLKLIYKARRV